MRCLSKIRAVVIFSLFFFVSGISGQPVFHVTTLETVNSFQGEWCCSNNGYLYGTSRTNVLRKTEHGQNIETRGDVRSVDPAFLIENRIYSTSVPGLIFILVKNDTDNHFLLRSRDGGATFSLSFVFGEGNGPGGTNTGNVRLLRGILELTRDLANGTGMGTLFIGEYNVNRFRTPGAINDRVRILKSTDHGNSWSRVVEWNTNGTNQVGHIHAMKQDPYTGEIYICTGDADSRSGIIKWDGVSQWRNNITLGELRSMRGFRVLSGAQRYRAVDVLFDKDHFYTFSDTQKPNNPDGSESGIWRGNKDLSSFSRVDNKIYQYDPMHVGWFGEKIGDTFIFTTAREYIDPDNAWKELNTQVYVSNDGVSWHATGLLSWRDSGDQTAGRYPANVFSWNNRLYVDCMQGAGHYATIQCELARVWRSGDEPVILHPVYFVGNWKSDGSDSNSGRSADSPRKTLGSILADNNISSGARVRVAEGDYYENYINPIWSGAAFQGKGSVIVEGEGAENTLLIWSPRSSYPGLRIEGSRTRSDNQTPIIFKNMGFMMNSLAGNTHVNYIIHALGSNVKTINCRFGGKGNDDSPLINLASPGTKFESENSIYITGSVETGFNNILTTSSINTHSTFINSVFLNSDIGLNLKHRGSGIVLKHCTFYGTGKSAIVFGTDCDRPPYIKNCIFSSGDPAIIDYSGMIEKEVDYNYYAGRIVNVSDGGHSKSGSDPAFVDPQNGILTLKSYSPCAMAGITLTDVLFDISGRERRRPPCLGAYEVPALYTVPGSLILNDAGQSTVLHIIASGEWKISSFDEWIHLSSLSGNESSDVTVSAAKYIDSDQPRTGYIVITGRDVSQYKLAIIQLNNPGNASAASEFDKLKIFPVPVSNLLHIEFGDERITSFSIVNSAGAIMSVKAATGLSQDVNFSGYGSGIYVLEFASTAGRFHRVMVIKNR